MTDPALLLSEDENGRVVIHLRGEIDLLNVDDLEAQIDRAVADVDDVVIDLTAVEFIDSTGLRLLKRVSTALSSRNATLVVVAPPNSIARSVLDITRMSDELAISSSITDTPGPTGTSGR